MNGLPLLSLHDIGLQVGGKWLLRDITTTLMDARCTVLLGPNGAGKSLLLRLCHGLIAASCGRLDWHGGTTPRQTMVFQHPVMLRGSVLQNMALAFGSEPGRKKNGSAMDALEWAGLSAYANHSAQLLSQGLQQQIAIARARAFRPRLLFLDEPTANLDPESTVRVEAIIAKLVAQGVKVLMSTHNLAQARRLAGDVLFISNGRLQAHQQADSFFAQPACEAATDYIRLEALTGV